MRERLTLRRLGLLCGLAAVIAVAAGAVGRRRGRNRRSGRSARRLEWHRLSEWDVRHGG